MNDFYCEKVLSGEEQVSVVVDTEEILAFYHTEPAYEKHIVVTPKFHVSDIITLSNMALIEKIFGVIKQVIEKESVVDYRIITNGGKYQDSKHLHFHVVSGDKL